MFKYIGFFYIYILFKVELILSYIDVFNNEGNIPVLLFISFWKFIKYLLHIISNEFYIKIVEILKFVIILLS